MLLKVVSFLFSGQDRFAGGTPAVEEHVGFALVTPPGADLSRPASASGTRCAAGFPAGDNLFLQGGLRVQFLAVALDMLLVGFHIVGQQEHGLAGEGGFDRVQRGVGFAFRRLRPGALLGIGSIGGEATLADGSGGFFCTMKASP